MTVESKPVYQDCQAGRLVLKPQSTRPPYKQRCRECSQEFTSTSVARFADYDGEGHEFELYADVCPSCRAEGL